MQSAESRQGDVWIASLIVFASALLLFSINLNRPPHPDELHHVLAAQHILETGRPLIGDGEYWRGILHTWMVAFSYEIFGEGLASARIPSVLLVALVSVLLFLWVRRESGRLAAWLTAGLFILLPFTVEIAQFSRFYSLQMFGFVLGAICMYYALAPVAPLSRRLLLGALSLPFFGLAVLAQVTSFVGLVGIGAFVVGLAVKTILFDSARPKRVKVALGVGMVVLVVVGVAGAMLSGALDLAWMYYRLTPIFNEDLQNEFWFYHIRFLLFYPTIWSLVGVVALFAMVKSPRLAWYSVSIFAISFLLMSFAGTKATRYLSFAPPFLAVVWGVGLAYVLPPLWRYVAATRDRIVESTGMSKRAGSLIGNAAVFVALAIFVLCNPFWLRTATIIGDVTLPGEVAATDWPAARDALASWLDEAEMVVTTEELGALYYLGRSDVRFSPSKLPEIPLDQQFEFGIDHRTGRPLITKPESIEQLIECFSTGLVVGPIEHWGSPILISKEVQDVIVKHAQPVDVPRKSHLYAWAWRHEPTAVKPGYCSELSRFSARRVD